jgi:hypothetical protein
MGNIASCIKSAAVCLAGAAVIVVAKPACDYTVKLVVKNTSLVVANHSAIVRTDIQDAIKLIKDTSESLTRIEDAQRTINERIDKELSKDRGSQALATNGVTSNELVDVGNLLQSAIKLIKDTSESLARVENAQKAINEYIDTELSRNKESLYLMEEGQRAINERVVIEMSESKRIAEDARELALSTAPHLLPKISGIEAAVARTASDIADANKAIGALPGVIDDTAKRYSMYLHNEHSSLFEVLSAKN